MSSASAKRKWVYNARRLRKLTWQASQLHFSVSAFGSSVFSSFFVFILSKKFARIALMSRLMKSSFKSESVHNLSTCPPNLSRNSSPESMPAISFKSLPNCCAQGLLCSLIVPVSVIVGLFAHTGCPRTAASTCTLSAGCLTRFCHHLSRRTVSSTAALVTCSCFCTCASGKRRE